jgi:hypothetical protein
MSSDLTSAVAALAGALIGGMASFGSSWITQAIQSRDKLLEMEHSRRASLFADFIDEATRLYGDALTHQKDEVGDIVLLYAILARIRLVASEPVVRTGTATLDRVIATYLAPNRALHELRDLAAAGDMDFLHDFSEAARQELNGIGKRAGRGG